jgi:hypothetical protein
MDPAAISDAIESIKNIATWLIERVIVRGNESSASFLITAKSGLNVNLGTYPICIADGT